MLLRYKSTQYVFQNIWINKSKTKARFTIDRYQILSFFNRDIFKWHVKAIRALLDHGGSLSFSEIKVMVESEEESNLLNEDVK